MDYEKPTNHSYLWYSLFYKVSSSNVVNKKNINEKKKLELNLNLYVKPNLFGRKF